jgi:hypothetical protein
MLYETFKALGRLIGTVTEIQAVQWYNAQYEGIIYATPVVFIEFPNRIPLEQTAGAASRANFAVRIHIVSASQAMQDNSIPDDVIADHEAIAEKVLGVLQGRQIPVGTGLSTSLMPCGWQHYHAYRGFMVTFVEFEASAFGLRE